MTGIQRRRSGIYEARCILPKDLAGRPAPVLLQARFPDLVNAKTGNFKLEVSRSLKTQDPHEAKRRGRSELRAITETIEDAKHALLDPDLAPLPRLILTTEISEIASEIHAEWLRWDRPPSAPRTATARPLGARRSLMSASMCGIARIFATLWRTPKRAMHADDSGVIPCEYRRAMHPEFVHPVRGVDTFAAPNEARRNHWIE